MNTRKLAFIILAAVLLFNTGHALAQTVPAASQQDELIAVLTAPDATRQQKATACRELSFIATKRAVPALASLLADEDLNHMARYALEPLPDTAVDDALLRALGTLKGKPLVGVIGSLGVRGEARAVAPLAKRLSDQDPMIARATARALGHIGNAEAVQALSGALSRSDGDTRLAVCDGLFDCAHQMGGTQAVKIYQQLLQSKAPHQVRSGALRAAILAQPNDMDLLNSSLRNRDYHLFSAAAQATLDMSGPKVTQALTGSMGDLAADRQIVILSTLAKRGDPAALPAIVAAAGRGDRAVRIAAIKAIVPVGNASALDGLVTLIKDADKQIVEAAMASLAAMPGAEAERRVIGMLETGDRGSQLQALDLIGRRKMQDVTSALLKAARGGDASIRVASIKMLGDLEGAVPFSVLIDLLLGAQSAREIQAAEQALSALCKRDAQPLPGQVTVRRAVYGAVDGSANKNVTRKVTNMINAGALAIEASNGNFGDPANGLVKQLRIEFTRDGVTQVQTVREGQRITLLASVTPPAYVQALCTAMPQAEPAQKRAILRVLRVAQGAKALDAVRSAMQDSHAAVSGDAVSIFCGWPSVDVLPEVLELARTATELKVKIVAVRGAIRLIPMQDITGQEKLEGFKALLPLIQRDDEKRLLLGSLAEVPLPETLTLAASYLDGSSIQNEACFAVVAIAEKMSARHRAKVTEVLQKVLKTTTNEEVKKRATQILRRRSGE